MEDVRGVQGGIFFDVLSQEIDALLDNACKLHILLMKKKAPLTNLQLLRRGQEVIHTEKGRRV